MISVLFLTTSEYASPEGVLPMAKRSVTSSTMARVPRPAGVQPATTFSVSMVAWSAKSPLVTGMLVICAAAGSAARAKVARITAAQRR